MELITYAVFATVAIIYGVHKILRLSQTNKLKTIMILEFQTEDILSEIIQHTDVDRALVVKMHNGGAKIKMGDVKKISIISEPSDSLEPHTKKSYQNFEIDRNYRQVMADLLGRPGWTYHETKDLKPGIFERKSASDNITSILHHRLCVVKSGMYFTFLATVNENSSIILGNLKQSQFIEEKVNELRQLYNQAKLKKTIE